MFGLFAFGASPAKVPAGVARNARPIQRAFMGSIPLERRAIGITLRKHRPSRPHGLSSTVPRPAAIRIRSYDRPPRVADVYSEPTGYALHRILFAKKDSE